MIEQLGLFICPVSPNWQLGLFIIVTCNHLTQKSSRAIAFITFGRDRPSYVSTRLTYSKN
ncbi:hypothetical protein [Nostoc sp.]|uniref:hypothetical protein n=1 Tax=Nostoc sp. TaxID=1180 RepID=UPI002FF4A1D0